MLSAYLHGLSGLFGRRRARFSVVMVLTAMGATLAWSCAGTDEPNKKGDDCREGVVVEGYLCENGQWVEHDGPCVGVSCGKNGDCIEQDDQAQCQCDDGYVADGQQCIAENACDGVDCGSNGNCTTDSDGDPRCSCGAGYEADGLSCEPIHDPCVDRTCGPNGDCVVEDGDAECDCDDGYEPAGLVCAEIETEPEPCDDIDCGPNGDCVESNGEGECACIAGYEAQNDYCFEIGEDLCDSVNCGPGGSCVEQGGNAQCSCSSGYEPSDNGLQCIEIPAACANVSGDCGIYILYAGTSQYDVIDYRDTDLAAELDGPIVAAFDIEQMNRAYLLTETSYYRVTTSDFSVVESGALTGIHPELSSGSQVVGAYSIPAAHNGASVGEDGATIIEQSSGTNTHGRALPLGYDPGSSSFESELDPAWVEFTWTQDLQAQKVPSTSAGVRAMWLDHQNSRGFASGSVDDHCTIDAPDTMTGIPIQAVMTDTDIHYAAATHCFPFVQKDSYVDSWPMSRPQAPSAGDIGAAFWHGGSLYIFAGGR
jgi:hypothetical protein